MDNNSVPVPSMTEYQKGPAFLNYCLGGPSINQKAITKVCKALFHCPVIGSRNNYYEHQMISSESLFECFTAVHESMATIIELLFSGSEMQIKFKVKFLWAPIELN